ncbi:MAG: MFS transporter [Bryobacter sp.]|nr:MFS transporter [Bryobacter sp.]
MRALAIVYATIFLDVLGLGVLIPVLPYYVRQFNTDAATVGWLSVSFSAAQFLASPFLGALSDRFGRRPIILWNILGSAGAYYLFGWANSLWLLMTARVIEGITGGSISTAQAYIADVTPPQERMKRFGLIGAVFGLGFILGPAFGGLLSKISLAAPAYAAGTLCLLAAVFGFLYLPESLPPEKRRQEKMALADLNPFLRISQALARVELRSLLLAIFAVNVAFSGLQSNFAVFTLERFGFGPTENSYVFIYIGALSIFMQGVVVRRLPKAWNPLPVVAVGLLLMAIGFVGIAQSVQDWHMFPAIAIMAFGNGVAAPTLTSLISQRSAAQEQGSILGATQGVLSSTRILGPLYAGYAFDWLGSGSPYTIGALLTALALGIILQLRAQESHTTAADKHL